MQYTLLDEYELKNSEKNKLAMSDTEFHDWYRFVLSYPPHLVRKYFKDFNLTSDDVVLDPFCGTGTTLVEAKLHNIPSIGIEANHFAYFASSIKTDWNIDADFLYDCAVEIKDSTLSKLYQQGISDEIIQYDKPFKLRTLTPVQEKLILKDSISPLPLHKSLCLLDQIERFKNAAIHKYLLLAFGNALVYQISNLKFGPEVGVGKIKEDAEVVNSWFKQITKICNDLSRVQGKQHAAAEIIHSDSRVMKDLLNGKKVTAVITSPPYPNEKDYTRTTRLESVLLNFIGSKEQLRIQKRQLLRSNTRGVYKGDNDDDYVRGFPEIQRIADEIERKRIELNKNSGFERLYSKVTKLYFGGMAKHLIELSSVLAPNAQLAYVVGDQASFLRVMIPTGKLIAEIAESVGYELVRIDLFRTRFSTATKSNLNEEVVVLRWKG
jgi:hypothetical protein